MPIKYQRLESSAGGGLRLELTSYPNTEITLSSDTNTYTKTSNSEGVTIFEGVEPGFYMASSAAPDQKQFMTAIMVEDGIKKGLACAQVKDLPIGSKIMLSNGISLILMNKNLEGHYEDSATFVSEFIVDSFIWDKPYYSQTQIAMSLLTQYYYELIRVEQKALCLYDMTTKFLEWDPFSSDIHDGVVKSDRGVSSYFYLLSAYELGTSYGNKLSNDGVPIGFTDDDSKIKYFKHQKEFSIPWFLRSFETVDYSPKKRVFKPLCINNTGKDESSNGDIGDTNNYPYGGIVPACDILLSAYVSLRSDGYYEIVGI